MDDIRRILSRLSHIYGKKFQYAWIKNETTAKNIINEWYRVLMPFEPEIYDLVIDKIATTHENPPSLSEFKQLCERERNRIEIKANRSPETKNLLGFCPLCGKNIDKNASDCTCGWNVNTKAVMPNHPPKCNWENMQSYLTEYQKLLQTGTIHNGYEYFKLKIGTKSFC